jgi:glycosyltransferase involved in cell wall biosynthesis
MKILLTSLFFSPSVGGIETVTLLLAREFMAAGHQVRIVTTTPSSDPAANHGFQVLRQPSFGQLFAAARWCDVYLQNNISLPLAAPLLLLRRPWFIVHQTWIPQKWGGLVGQINRGKLLLLRHATSVSISNAVAADMPGESTVIPNPYDADVFHTRADVPRTGDLVALGRLVSDKGFDLLVEALALLAREGLRPRLTLIGDGPEKENLRQQAKNLGVADQIVFAGARTGAALAEELNRHRIAVVPSRWKEPFGIVALEMIACGCVTVGSKDGGLADAIGACGPTFPNGDAAALAETLGHLLRHPDALAPYLKCADAHLRRHHPAAIAAEYLQLFDQALSHGP